jgi:glycosyltransferase involved in cell wall biosynthesis
MRIVADPLHIAIDGNEANVTNRVGSNVYAYEILNALEEQTRGNPTIAITILLAVPPLSSLPVERKGWKYKVIGPKKFWTQWALPIHLFNKRKIYDIFFTPGHYAPRLCPIPYVSSVMDTAYLDYPEQFTPKDRVQLTKWTKYSVEKAKKILVISEYTKKSVVDHYKKNNRDVVVAYPAIRPHTYSLPKGEEADFFKKNKITDPYFLFVGTLQPRKNVHRLIDAYEIVRDRLKNESMPADQTNKRKKKKDESPPQLVLAGKIGWLAEPILARINRSPYAQDIIMTGFVSELEKKALYTHACCLVLIGLHEGFGIPPLEAMQYGTIPVVANTTSLPEVVGDAGFTVEPTDIDGVAQHLWKILHLKTKERAQYLRKGREQVKTFSWDKSAEVILKTLLSIVDQTYHG